MAEDIAPQTRHDFFRTYAHTPQRAEPTEVKETQPKSEFEQAVDALTPEETIASQKDRADHWQEFEKERRTYTQRKSQVQQSILNWAEDEDSPYGVDGNLVTNAHPRGVPLHEEGKTTGRWLGADVNKLGVRKQDSHTKGLGGDRNQGGEEEDIKRLRHGVSQGHLSDIDEALNENNRSGQHARLSSQKRGEARHHGDVKNWETVIQDEKDIRRRQETPDQPDTSFKRPPSIPDSIEDVNNWKRNKWFTEEAVIRGDVRPPLRTKRSSG